MTISRPSSIAVFLLIPFLVLGQEENKKKKSLGERFSTMTGKLMTQKSDNLGGVSINASVVSGLFDMRTEVTETKFYPAGTREGDHAVAVTFMKASGIGMVDLQGEVTSDGEPMTPVGLGTFIKVYPEPGYLPRKLAIRSASGETATFILNPVPEIEIIGINGLTDMPIIDLAEDLTVSYINPPGSENTTVSAGLLTDFMGTRSINFFADFPAGEGTVTIPKESFSNASISGKLGAGQFNKGKNFLVLRRQVSLTDAELGPEQQKGPIASTTLQSVAYSSWPVIVKGKQEQGVITELSFAGKFSQEKIGYEVFKPNARTGIPFSRGSNFGLASLTVNGTLYKKETEVTSNSWEFGNTRYTRTTTVTTTLQFPQLPGIHWDNLLEAFYNKMTDLFREKYNIDFVAVERVTWTKDYKTLFPVEPVDTYVKLTKNYRDTRRTSPKKLGEAFAALNSSVTGENPMQLMMREAGIDGLVSVEINFRIATDKADRVVLIPSIDFAIRGMDENRDNKYGVYAEGTMTFQEGIPFNEKAVRDDANSLIKVLNVNQMIACLDHIIGNLKTRETEMGFDKIWSTGEK